ISVQVGHSDRIRGKVHWPAGLKCAIALPQEQVPLPVRVLVVVGRNEIGDAVVVEVADDLGVEIGRVHRGEKTGHSAIFKCFDSELHGSSPFTTWSAKLRRPATTARRPSAGAWPWPVRIPARRDFAAESHRPYIC